jgi:Tfp pilus assembly protein PilF
MGRRILLIAGLLATPCLAGARGKNTDWIEVHSPHFAVVSNSNEKQARRVADQFERMRSVFHVLFPKLQLDPGAPIVILAVNGEKEFRALEPEVYLAKGQLKLGGLFLRTEEKNYVLMRLDAEGEHPYSVVYHEYTHLLMSKSEDWLPLWLNEGLAEFYQNTDIHEKDVMLGQASVDNIMWLRENRMLPLPALFAVDHNSPYYHEENKGSIFYAESWALVHYIHVQDYKQKMHRLSDYADLLAKKADPMTAATTAFGDLKKLQKELEMYVQQGMFSYFSMKTLTEVDESKFTIESLSAPDADALRADFLACNQRTIEARALLDHVLQEDPTNASAHETMGYLEFRDGHLDEARKWYAQAVQSDSQSFLANYYYAAMSMEGRISAEEETRVEDSLRRAIKLNPTFAPSFDRLAVFLGSRHRNLEEAHMMGLTAISLEPSNVAFRMNVANVLMEMQRAQDAVMVLQAAAKLAKTQEERLWIDNALEHAQQFQSEQDRGKAEQRLIQPQDKTGDATSIAAETAGDTPRPHLVRREFAATGPHRFVTGVIQDVHCDSQTMDLAVKAAGKMISLHSDDYYRISFSALGFQPGADLKPCSELEGRPAKIEYQESADRSVTARLVSIELHK